MFVITAERPGDGPAIETLLDRTFGAERHEKTAYRYRDGIAPVPGLGLIALDRGRKRGNGAQGAGSLIGSIRFWPIWIGTDTPALLLGPLAVSPDRGGDGIGRALMRQSLDLTQMRGHGIVLLVGPLDYYGQFGFRPAAPLGITMPHEARERLLVAELAPNALAEVGGDGFVRRWVRCRAGQGLGKKRIRLAARRWRPPTERLGAPPESRLTAPQSRLTPESHRRRLTSRGRETGDDTAAAVPCGDFRQSSQPRVGQVGTQEKREPSSPDRLPTSFQYQNSGVIGRPALPGASCRG